MKPTENQQEQEKKDDQYATALAKMAALDYQMQEKSQPEQKHFISKKVLAYIVLSLIISILTLVVGHFLTRNNTKEKDNETINQLLETTKDVRDLENQ